VSANLIHHRQGPWFFLGEILLEDELEPTPPRRKISCGTCTACLEACPTGAIREAGVVDSRRCISYQTIENRGSIPHELRSRVGEWVFGCDVCAEVCPRGAKAPDVAARFGTSEGVERGDLAGWLRSPPETFAERFEGSALRRPRREGLARNAAVVLGNRPSDAGRRALGEALALDPSPLVREAAAWGLLAGHGEDAEVRSAVEGAHGREEDPEAREGIARSLERATP